MSVARLFSFSLLLLVLLALTLWAQTPPSRGSQGQAPKTGILIDHQAVRFVNLAEAQQWRLEITNQQGAVVFDSGLISGTSLDWPLRNPQGETVEGGLYAY